ncbi:MAG: 30S ribosome-binding factor RbfA [Peptococcaceae bacterium]|nr:30S ribosome-binding factor RbfA [Peptococcaceae bacterium]
MGHRPERLAEVIKQEVSQVIRRLKDPRIGFITVTNVELSPDFRYAKIFVSILEPKETQEASMEALKRAKGHIRTELGRRIRLRHTPEITFVLDESLREGAKIIDLINRINKQAPNS